MPAKPGKNAGISGVIDLPNAPSGQQLLQVLIRRWDLRLEGSPRARRGRGGGRFATYRWIMASGLVSLGFRIQSEGPPTPEAWDGLEGNLTIRYTPDKTVTYPVTIGAYTHSFTPQSDDTWGGMVTAQIAGPPTYSEAWGDPPIPSTQTKTDQILWENSVKVHDPNGLQSSATLMIDWWDDVADTDAAEVTKITTVLASATEPMTGLKVRTATFMRDAIDGGTIQVAYGLTDTADDVVNQSTAIRVDPSELATGGTVATINDSTPTIPTISGQTVVERFTTSREVNDSKTLYITEFGNRSTQADLENPGTYTITDASDIDSKGLQTSVYANGGSVTAASVPSGLQTVSTKIETINADRKMVTYEFAKNTSKQAIEFPGTFTNIDSSDLENTGRQTSVYSAGGSPTAAADLSASKLYVTGTTIRFINPDQKQVIYDYARQTNAQRIVNNAKFVFVDPSGLESREVAASIDGTPSLGTVTSDRGTKTVYLNPDHYLKTTEGGLRTTQQDREFPGTFTVEDPSAIESSGKQTSIYATAGSVTAASPPTVGGVALQKVRTKIQQENATKSIVEYDFEIDSPAQKIAQRNTFKVIDVSGLRTAAQVALVNGTPTAPTEGGVTFQKRSTRTEPVTHLQNVTVEEYGLTTPQQDLEFGNTKWVTRNDTEKLTITASLAADSISGTNLRDSLWSANKADATWLQAEVEQVVPGKFIQKVTTDTNDYRIVSSTIRTYRDTSNAIPENLLSGGASYSSGVAIVLIGKLSAVVVGGPGGATSGRIDPIEWWRTEGQLVVEKRRAVSKADIDTYKYNVLRKHTNASEFLGEAAHTVMYEGCTVEGRIPSGTDTGVLTYRYFFAVDDAMFFSAAGIPTGWVDAGALSYFTSPGYVDPATVMDTDTNFTLTISWPDDDSDTVLGSDFDDIIS